MENTGRIQRGIKLIARQIVFGLKSAEDLEREMQYITEVDLAHVFMLAKGGIIGSGQAKKLLKEILELRTGNFAPLKGKLASRGNFLLYEDYLIEKTGIQIGGMLQTGRSRNDLNATVIRLKLRDPFIVLLKEILRLQAIVLRRSKKYSGICMPAFTHFQPAVPITLGHYLLGFACALQRDIEEISSLIDYLNQCPLGACAIGGTSLPVDSGLTAKLLGFNEPLLNSIDAVASRDLILRILAAITILGSTISRISMDLLLWTTDEFGFLNLPDELVGSSSIMPQKRNPFLLEHVQGRSSAPLGAFVTAVTAIHGTPFSNSIAAGAESLIYLWDSLQKTAEAVILLRLVIAGAEPNGKRMIERAESGFTTATEFANRLMISGQFTFRAAHRVVGEVVSKAHENKTPLQHEAKQLFGNLNVNLSDLDAESVAKSSEFGGGPGLESQNSCLNTLRQNWSQKSKELKIVKRQWTQAHNSLINEVNKFLGL